MNINPPQVVTGTEIKNTKNDQDNNLNTLIAASSVPNDNNNNSNNNNIEYNPPTNAVDTTLTEN